MLALHTMDANSARRRVDSHGRAFAGSQRWIQYYVNWQPSALNRAILDAIPSLSELHGTLEWVSPLESDSFSEYQDEDFLARLGLVDHIGALRNFWPRGGPWWDALARIRKRAEIGVILLEAKSYPAEMIGNGRQACRASRMKIERALAATKTWLGADTKANWLGPVYQHANRLAHLYFFREVVRIPAWLVDVCFISDPHSPTTLADWQSALGDVRASLGLAVGNLPVSATVFLEAKEQRKS